MRRFRLEAWPGLLGLGLGLITLSAARADEGMWTFDRLPAARIQERYGFTPTPAWIDQVRSSCVRFGGASGAFVTADGLVLTNHHVAMDQLQKLSTPQADYVRDGFCAPNRAGEIPCPDLELRVLVSTEDVTGRVLAAVRAGDSPERQSAARRAVMAGLEAASAQETGLKSEVVELYRGGEYWLYRYRTCTDVRLVMSPETGIAFFGGDEDNFTYPRYNLDITFFRIYDNGQPVHPEHWMPLSRTGPTGNELLFTAGHPGSTSRLETMSQLEYERDLELPIRIERTSHRLAAYYAWGKRGPEESRQIADRTKGLENQLKRWRGYLACLQGGTMEARRQDEVRLRAEVAARPELKAACGDAWDRIAVAQKALAGRHREVLHRDLSRVSRLVDFATTIVRSAAEADRPNEQRLPEYRDSNLETQRFRLFSRAPIYRAMEEYILADALNEMLRALGPDDPFVKAALNGRPADAVAREIIGGTTLIDPAVRRELWKGGQTAVEASTDPLIAWARRIDGPWRELRQWQEDHVQTVESVEGNRIARALFALRGDAMYPDATGTLRLSYGRTAGYEEGTTLVPWKTTFWGLYERAAAFDGRAPFDLPPRWIEARGRIALDTPFNFVTTNDIVGGSSGSPVFNRNGECTGVVFDGNIPAFAWDYAYSDVAGRTVAVDSAAIFEALRRIYDMGWLADELEAAGRR